jgi:hypothetical protein
MHFFAILVVGSLIVAGSLLVYFGNSDELYKYPVSVGEKTYVVGVRTDYPSAPEVQVSDFSNYVSVEFTGEKQTGFCEITIPTDLIWGEISLINKYYKMSGGQYTQSNNGTHNLIYFTFNQPALVKHFSVKGTEGAFGEFL